jgi:hypothetical protein
MEAIGELVDGEHGDGGEAIPPARGVALDEQQLRMAIVDTKGQALGPEQGEERHGDGAALHGAEQRPVEGQRGLEHDGHAVAARDARLLEEVREAR